MLQWISLFLSMGAVVYCVVLTITCNKKAAEAEKLVAHYGLQVEGFKQAASSAIISAKQEVVREVTAAAREVFEQPYEDYLDDVHDSNTLDKRVGMLERLLEDVVRRTERQEKD